MLIILGGGIYSFVKYLDYKSEIEQIHADTQIRLAEINTANPDANNYKEDRNPQRVKRIVNKDTLQVAEVAFN
ncbi:MAG: hypothetical protein IPJ03_16095 [Ignavibacteriales bacterium]|nr:hypothetical protein [Ignavibacteriales bacterium]